MGLDQNNITTIREELAALEKNPVNGWDKIYPALYKALYETVHELCITLNCSMPGLVIQCQGVQSLQASAHIMLDGTTQLHLGSGFIREYMLDTNEKSQRCFRWVIAHELSHLADPVFRKYGSKISYTVRTIIDRFIAILFFIGIGYLFLTQF